MFQYPRWTYFPMFSLGLSSSFGDFPISSAYTVNVSYVTSSMKISPNNSGNGTQWKTANQSDTLWSKETIYYVPRTQMTSIFKGQPPKTRPKLQSKQGSFGFQVYLIVQFLVVSKYRSFKFSSPRNFVNSQRLLFQLRRFRTLSRFMTLPLV